MILIRKFSKGAVPLALTAGLILFGGSAQAAEEVSWVGMTWDYETFDNGQGLAGYTLTNDGIAPAEAGCRQAATTLFSKLDGVEGAERQGNPLVLRTNSSLRYRLKYGVDMEASVYESESGCGARITVLNPLQYPG